LLHTQQGCPNSRPLVEIFKRIPRYFVFQGMVILWFYTGSIVQLKKSPGTAVVDTVISV